MWDRGPAWDQDRALGRVQCPDHNTDTDSGKCKVRTVLVGTADKEGTVDRVGTVDTSSPSSTDMADWAGKEAVAGKEGSRTFHPFML